MKIQLLSDLHNEFLRNGRQNPNHKWTGEIPETEAEVIILAGDIDTGTYGIEWAIKESQRLGKNIIYVLGNHEYYRHEYTGLKEKIAKQVEGTAVHCLNYGVYIQGNVRFIGATLWTDYKADTSVPQDLAMFFVEKGLADHKMIKYKAGNKYRKFQPADALAIHKKELHWLEKQIKTPYKGKTVVITHHGPHPICQHPLYPVSEISAAFHSDLSELIENNDIDIWSFGHTHANVDKAIVGTRIISNQAGYPGENVNDFNAAAIIEI